MELALLKENPLKGWQRKREEERLRKWRAKNRSEVASYIGREALSPFEFDKAMSYSDSSSPELAIHLYRLYVRQMQNDLSGHFSLYDARKFLQLSLEQILNEREDLLPQWVGVLEAHSKLASKEKYGLQLSDIGSGMDNRDRLVEALVKQNCHERVLHLPQFADYSYGFGPEGGEDLATMIEVAKFKGDVQLARRAILTNPSSLPLAELLFAEFTRKDGVPLEGLQNKVLETFMRHNYRDPSTIEGALTSYLKTPRSADALLQLSRQVSYLGPDRNEGTGSDIVDLKLKRHYRLRAAEIALDAARISDELKDKALEEACMDFSCYIGSGGFTGNVPDMLIEHALRKTFPWGAECSWNFSGVNWCHFFLRDIKADSRYEEIKGWLYDRMMDEDLKSRGQYCFIGGADESEAALQRPKSSMSYEGALGALGLDPKKSYSPAELKSAWREATKKWHPDINKSPEAEGRMKQVNNAYEALKGQGLIA